MRRLCEVGDDCVLGRARERVTGEVVGGGAARAVS